MMVLILSGNQAGSIVDLPRPEAEAALSTGYAALAPEPGPITPTEAELRSALNRDEAAGARDGVEVKHAKVSQKAHGR